MTEYLQLNKEKQRHLKKVRFAQCVVRGALRAVRGA